MSTSPTDDNLGKTLHSTPSPPSPEIVEAFPQLHSGILLPTPSDKHDSDLSTATSVELDSNNTGAPHSTTQVRQLFVGNLPFRVRWQDLKDLFRKAGKVVRADVALSFDNRSKGHGTVLFATIEDAQAAIDMLHNCKWHGRTLEVREDRGYFEQPFMKKSSSSSSASTSSLPTTRKILHAQQINHQNHQKHAPSRTMEDQQQGFTKLGPNSHSTRPNVVQSGRQLFVGNLPFHCQWQDVKDLFRSAGKIIRADVAQEPGGKSRGFGTVLYTTFEDAENAIAMFDGYEYQGRQLRVHFDKFASGQSHHHYHHYDHQHQQRQMHDYQLHQPSRFGNLEFGQVTDPGVLENLKQTYGGIITGGYAAFMMGQSPYLSTSNEVAFSPLSDDAIIAQKQSEYGTEIGVSGYSTSSHQQRQQQQHHQQQQQHQSTYSQHRSNYNMAPAPPYIGYYSTTAPMIPSLSNSNGSYDQDMSNQQNASPFGVDDLVESDIGPKPSSSFFMYDQNPCFMSPSPHHWTRSPQEKQEPQQNQQFNMYLPPLHQSPLKMSQHDDLHSFYSYRRTQQNGDDSGPRDNDYRSTTDNLNDEMQKMGLSDSNRNGSAGLETRGDSAPRNGFGINGQHNSNNNGGGGGTWDPLSGLKI